MSEQVKDTDQNLKKYFDILELNGNAALVDIKNSYQHLKKLYSSQPPVLSPILDEVPDKKRKEILGQLDEAYTKLNTHFSEGEKQKIKTARQRVADHHIPEFEVFSGNALKLTREVLGIELQEISLFSGIPLKHLKNIELEKFDLLPPKGYIKVFLKKYAEYLSLDPHKVIDDYFKVYDKKKS